MIPCTSRSVSIKMAVQKMSFMEYVDVERDINYREGQFLEADELVLYALMKVTANPMMNPKTRNLGGDRKAVVRWNAALVCKTLGKIYGAKYNEDDLYYYLCCMLNLDDVGNSSMIGIFDGMPRIDYFAPYVDIYLSKCSYPLIRILNGAGNCILEVVTEAGDICKQIVDGTVAALVPVKPFVISQLRFSSMHLLLVDFPNWKYELMADVLMLWQPSL